MEKITHENIVTMYYYIALASTIFYIIKTFLFSVFGGDTEVHTDFNASIETDTSFDFLSIQSILAFLMGFGWVGIACLKEWNFSVKLTILISLIFGFILMFLSAYMMFCVKKLNKKVVKNLANCIGKTAKAYTRFEPSGKGQIEVEVNGQLSIEYAVNNSNLIIESFMPVKVVKYDDNTLYIEKI